MNDTAQVMLREDHGHLRVLRLNRPHAKNALDGPLLAAITNEVRAAAHDDSVRAIVLTGEGDAFCAGLDLATAAAAAEPSSDPGRRARNGYDAADNMAMVMRVECTKPIVAGVNGAAVGIGVALAMAADIRIAAPTAKFHPGYARLGTSPDGGATWTVAQAIGYEGAMRFFLESRTVHAEELLALGLVSEVVPPEVDLEQRIIDYGLQLASLAPMAARQTKQMLTRVTMLADLADHLDDEVRLTRRALGSQDGRRAIEAFMTGGTPEFTGD